MENRSLLASIENRKGGLAMLEELEDLIYANSTRTARRGDQLKIRLCPIDLPILQRPSDVEVGCVTCVESGQLLTFSEIPPEVQGRLGIAVVVLGTFVKADEDFPDQIQLLPNECVVELGEFLYFFPTHPLRRH